MIENFDSDRISFERSKRSKKPSYEIENPLTLNLFLIVSSNCLLDKKLKIGCMTKQHTDTIRAISIRFIKMGEKYLKFVWSCSRDGKCVVWQIKNRHMKTKRKKDLKTIFDVASGGTVFDLVEVMSKVRMHPISSLIQSDIGRSWVGC